ncbi:MAG: hypothetical protein RR435_07790, partial [Erysipelotrichaceae bacterium]
LQKLITTIGLILWSFFLFKKQKGVRKMNKTNKEYIDILYNNLIKEVASQKGVKTLSVWCQEKNLDRHHFYQISGAFNRKQNQSLSKLLMICDQLEVDFVDLLDESYITKDVQAVAEALIKARANKKK